MRTAIAVPAAAAALLASLALSAVDSQAAVAFTFVTEGVQTLPAAGDTPAPEPDVTIAQEGNGGPDIDRLALITTASILGAAGAGLVLYLVRQRIGFWLHRPPPREEGDASQHD